MTVFETFIITWISDLEYSVIKLGNSHLITVDPGFLSHADNSHFSAIASELVLLISDLEIVSQCSWVHLFLLACKILKEPTFENRSECFFLAKIPGKTLSRLETHVGVIMSILSTVKIPSSVFRGPLWRRISFLVT